MSAAAYQEMDVRDRMTLRFEVEEFLAFEAALLDDRRYKDWLDLVTEDIHVWMPLRRTTTARDIANEFTKPGAVALIDDDYDYLKMRINRLLVGGAWAEDPPSRTRRFHSDVRILDVAGDDILVSVNFHLYRTRLDSEEDSWIGRREDLLRRNGDAFKIARRHIFLDQTVILSQNMSSIF